MIGLGFGFGFDILGSNVNQYDPATDADVNLLINSRSGLTLIDSIAANNAAIRLPMVDASRVDTTHGLKIDTGITPVVNTIIAFKGRATVANASHGMGLQTNASNNFYLAVTATTFKWRLGWANRYADSVANADTDYHVFIIYNGSLWVLPVTTLMTDASLLNAIATVTPTCTVATPTWTALDRTFWFGSFNASYVYLGSFAYSEAVIGTITTGVITRQRHYIFNNIYRAYDTLNAANSAVLEQATVANPIVVPTRVTNEHGSTYCLDYGHTLLQRDQKSFISVPYVGGVPNTTVANPTGFVKVKDFSGNEMLNYTDCMIRFVGSQFARSNATLFSAEARAAASYYDSENANDWHITELNRNRLDSWQNTGYKGTKFIKTDSNSMQLDTASNIVQIITSSVDKTGSDFNTLLRYSGDYDLYYYPLWDKHLFTGNDVSNSLSHFTNTGQTETIATFGNYSGNWKWGKNALAPNNCIYAAPMDSSTILKLNTVNDAVTLIAQTEPGSLKWFSTILAPNGYLYGIPFNASKIIKINPINDTFTYFGSLGVFTQKYNSTLLINKIIYCFPYGGGEIMKIDTADDSISFIGTFTASEVNGASGFAKFGIAKQAPNGCIYVPPLLWTKALKVDPSTDTITEFGDFGTSFKWFASIITPDGIFYAFPYNDSRILRIDTNTDTITYITTGLIGGSGAELYGAAIFGANGLVYCIPFSANQIMVFDTSDESIRFIGDLSAINEQYYSACLAPNGHIYSNPYHYSTAWLKLLSNSATDKNIALSRCITSH